MSVASRKMTSYAKTDCVGASKGLFFGLLTLVSGISKEYGCADPSKVCTLW